MIRIVIKLATTCWLAIGCFLTAVAGAAQPPDVLRTLRAGHPRLYALDVDVAQVRRTIEDQPLARQWRDGLLKDAQAMLSQPPIEHKFATVRPRLLDKSRLALQRISTLAGLYRLSGDRRFAQRAREEMLAIAAFEDWGPKYFLDVAEMTHAMAIGYDWLYGFLSVEDRTTVRTAIVDKGLKQALPLYTAHRGWTTVQHNWNQVCNGGMIIGALAIADEEPALAAQIIAAGRESIVVAMKTFAPDGGWPEGPGYWNYATRYNVAAIAALESALGSDFDLKKTPGFAQTGFFRMQFTGPTGLTFNYADANANAGSAAQMLWLARAFDQPIYAGHERARAGVRGNIFHLFWFDGRGRTPQDDDLPRDAIFRGVQVAFFRSAWNDPDAVFLGFKGGDNKANHSHLDMGSFVLDALGQRWAMDLGPDDYGLPGYFGKERFTYYRTRTESHNTLTLDGQNQNPRAAAPLGTFFSSPDRSFAVADLTEGYAPTAKRCQRGIALLNRKQVLVQDELEAAQPAAVRWNFHTRAKIELQDALATLSLGQSKLTARILSPPGARFEVLPANSPQPQHQQPDVQNLTVHLPGTAGKIRIAVLLCPGHIEGPLPQLEPLDAWKEPQ